MDPYWRLLDNADYPFCYQIFPKWGKGDMEIDFDLWFEMEFGLWFHGNSYPRFQRFEVYVTSYENSYGLTKRKWFDGRVDQKAILMIKNDNLKKSVFIVFKCKNATSFISQKFK